MLAACGAGMQRKHLREDRMKFLGRGMVAGAVLAMTCALSIAAWAGGSGFGDDDDNSEEEGPSYFGFVRDTGGSTVPDAKVACDKQGYKQLRVVRRSTTSTDPKIPVETECTLQRI